MLYAAFASWFLISCMQINGMRDDQEIVPYIDQRSCWVSSTYIAQLARQSKYKKGDFLSWFAKNGDISWKKLPHSIKKKIRTEWYYEQYKTYCALKKISHTSLNSVRAFMGMPVNDDCKKKISSKRLCRFAPTTAILRSMYHLLPPDSIEQEISLRIMPDIRDPRSVKMCSWILPERDQICTLTSKLRDIKICKEGLCVLDCKGKVQVYNFTKNQQCLDPCPILELSDCKSISVRSSNEFLVACAHNIYKNISLHNDIAAINSSKGPQCDSNVYALKGDFSGYLIGSYKGAMKLFVDTRSQNGRGRDWYGIEYNTSDINMEQMVQLGNRVLCTANDTHVVLCSIAKQSDNSFYLRDMLDKMYMHNSILALIGHTETQFFSIDSRANNIMLWELQNNDTILLLRRSSIIEAHISAVALLRDDVVLIGTNRGVVMHDFALSVNKELSTAHLISHKPVEALVVKDDSTFIVAEREGKKRHLVWYSWNHYGEKFSQLYCRRIVQKNANKLLN